MISELPVVKIAMTGCSTGTVSIDGKDISNSLKGFDLKCRVGNVPEITLHAIGRLDVQGTCAVVSEYELAELTAIRETLSLLLDRVDALIEFPRGSETVIEATG